MSGFPWYCRVGIILLVVAVMVSVTLSSPAEASPRPYNHDCRLSLEKKIFPAYYDGHIRQNPDGTYYPGDAFYFVFAYAIQRECGGLRIALTQYADAMVVELNYTDYKPELITRRWTDFDYRDSDEDLELFEFLFPSTPHLFDGMSDERKERILERGNHSGNIPEQIAEYCKRHVDSSWADKYEKRVAGCVYGRVEIRAEGNADYCREFDFEKVNLDGAYKYSWFSIDGRSYPQLKRISIPIEHLSSENVSDIRIYPLREISYSESLDSKSKREHYNIYHTYFTLYDGSNYNYQFHGRHGTYIPVNKYAPHPLLDATSVKLKSKAQNNFYSLFDLDERHEEELCYPNPSKIELKVSTSKQYHARDKFGDEIHKFRSITKTGTLTPPMANKIFDVKFRYPTLLDIDALPAKNNDGTYYTDDPAAVVRYPDLKWAEQRWPLILFEEDWLKTSKPISNHFTHNCNATGCAINVTYEDIYHTNPLEYTNGHGIDVFAIHDVERELGRNVPSYQLTSWNLGDKMYTDASDGNLLFVRYDPQISDTHTWSVFSDGGLTSFENRHSLGIRYDGSVGGGPDDPGGAIHPDRRMKITDVYHNVTMSNGFETIYPQEEGYGFEISRADNIQDMTILDSVTEQIPEWFSFSGEKYEGSLLMSPLDSNKNMTFYEAGYSRFLTSSSLPEERLTKNFIDVDIHERITSEEFAGLDHTHLTNATYNYPYGTLSVPLNITAYKILLIENSMEHCTDDSKYICVSKDVTSEEIDRSTKIKSVTFSPSDDQEFITTSEFLLNNHRTENIIEPFTVMVFSDLYDMNVPQEINESTVLLLLNKSGIHYVLEPTNEALDREVFAIDNVTGDGTVNTRTFGMDFADFLNVTESVSDDDIMYQPVREFFSAYEIHDVTVDAQRESDTRSNTVTMTQYGQSTIEYILNMYPLNHLEATRAVKFIGFNPSQYFGHDYEVHIDGAHVPKQVSGDVFAKYNSNVCSHGQCMVRLDHDDPIDAKLVNIWGGIAQDASVDAIIIPKYEMDWDLAAMRIMYIAAALVAVFLLYVFVKRFAGSLFPKKRV